MRKSLVLSVAFILFLLTSCYQKETISSKLAMEMDVKKIAVSRIEDSGSLAELNGQDAKKLIEVISHHAIKQEGIVNMSSPEYMVKLYTKADAKQIYVWVGKTGETSSLMLEDDTHTIYTVSTKVTATLNDLLAISLNSSN